MTDTKSQEKKEKIYEVTSILETGFRRSGRAFSKTPTYLKESELTKEQKAEPMLVIRELSQKEIDQLFKPASKPEEKD